MLILEGVGDGITAIESTGTCNGEFRHRRLRDEDRTTEVSGKEFDSDKS